MVAAAGFAVVSSCSAGVQMVRLVDPDSSLSATQKPNEVISTASDVHYLENCLVILISSLPRLHVDK